MTHKTRFTVLTEFEENPRQIELTPTETHYVLTHCSDLNSLFDYIRTLPEERFKPEYDPPYMLRQIERLTWEGHVLRRALIVSGADMDKIDTGNEAWMAEKKRRPS